MQYLPFKIIRFASKTFGLSSHIPKTTSSIFRGFDNMFFAFSKTYISFQNRFTK